MAYDEKLAARIRPLLHKALENLGAPMPDVAERKMFGGLAFMIADVMRVGIVDEALMIRVDPAQIETLLTEPGARPMDFTGKPMKGFLFVDGQGSATATSLSRWIKRALVAPAPKKRATKSPSPAKRKGVVSKRVTRRPDLA